MAEKILTAWLSDGQGHFEGYASKPKEVYDERLKSFCIDESRIRDLADIGLESLIQRDRPHQVTRPEEQEQSEYLLKQSLLM